MTVSVLSRVTVDPTLGVAGTSEQVNVAGESAPLIETTKTDVGGVLDQRRVENLPVNGRSFASLAVVLPNVTQAPSFDPTKARTGSFSVEGGTGRNVNVTVDGGDNKDNVVGGILQNFSLEGIQEFAISTQRFSAANGRSAGALLSIVSKSGTNQLHGTAFGFFRDDKLNSNAPKLLAEANPSKFPNAGDAIKLPFSRQQFGGSIGGPIKTDKAFFFGTFERTREKGNSLVGGSDFAQIQRLQALNLGYTAARFIAQPFRDALYTIKTDFNPSPKNTFSVRFAGQNNVARNDQSGFLIVQSDPSQGDLQLNRLYNILGSYTRVVNSNTINQFLYQFSTFNNRILPVSDLPQLAFPDGVVVGRNGNVPQQTTQKKSQFRDDLTYNRGKNGFKFGADYVYERIGGFFAFVSTPEYDFNFTVNDILNNPAQFPQGLRTNQVLPGPVTCSFATGGTACTADDLAGVGAVGDIISAGGDPATAFRNPAQQFAFYVQDDYKASSRLTLNLGVRYDVDLGFVDSKNQANNRAVRLLRILRYPGSDRLPHNDRNNFSPRVGFAYDLRGNGRSVVRGGYGLYYDQSFQNVVTFAVQQANPEIYSSIINLDDNLSLATPAPVIPRPLVNPVIGQGSRTSGRAINPDYVNPYSQQSNIGFAQQIGRNMSIEFDYVHVLGLHEFTNLDINPRTGPVRGATRNQSSSGFPRVLAPLFAAHRDEIIAAFGQATPFGRIRYSQSDGRSRYDAFTASFTKRYSNKYQINAHYTLSRSLAYYGQSGDFGNSPQNPFRQFDPRADFGFTDSDERHRFVMSGVFDLPYGFQLAPIIQFSSPRRYSIFPEGFPFDINRDGVTNDREARTPGNDQDKLPPNTVKGDSFKQVNLRVSKYFNFNERTRLGLFFETFNLFNTANFGREFQNVVGTPDFGRPLNFFGATGFSEPLGIPFQAQLGFRLSF